MSTYLAGLRNLTPSGAENLPVQLEGIGLREKPLTYIELRRWGKAFIPLPFQKDVIEGLLETVIRAPACGLLALPTGSGKTLTASRVVLDVIGHSIAERRHAIWIAPQRELLFQAADALKAAWWSGAGPPSLNIRIVETGRHLEFDDHPTCWLMTPSMAQKGIRKFAGKMDVAIFDEAHHAAADVFGGTWSKLRPSNCEKPLLALGLSATPSREKREEAVILREAFDGNLFVARELGPNPVRSLIEEGVLSEPQFCMVSGVPAYARRSDITDTRSLRTLILNPERWAAVLDCLGQCEAGQVVVYAVDREHGKALTRHLRFLGEKAEYVDGEVPIGVRIAVFERFRNKTTRILVNVALMIEGVDCPAADSILLTYPVNSLSRLKQMIGRVLRGPAIGGTDECRVWSIDGSTKTLDKILQAENQRAVGWKLNYLPA